MDEWELAARYIEDANSDGDQETTGDVAWSNGNSGWKTQDVASRSDNALGLHDISGNVLEWNFD